MSVERLFKSVFALGAGLVWAGTVSGEALYKGSGADLVDPANWGLTAFPATDWYKLDGEAASFPADGFSLSDDLPASGRITLQYFPARTVTLDAGGHSLSTDKLVVSNMHRNDNDRFNPLVVSGGFSGLAEFEANTKCNVELRDGAYTLHALKVFNWFPTLVVGRGGTLETDSFLDNEQIKFDGNASYPQMTIRDGGVFRIPSRDESKDKNWMRAVYSAYYQRFGHFEILDGGAYVDDSRWPADTFSGGMNVRISGGSYLATNSAHAARCTCWAGASGTAFAVTNGVLKLSHFYLGYCDGDGFGNWDTGANPVGTAVTFHDSKETFAYAPDYKAAHPTYPAGLGFGPRSARNTLVIDGVNNVFTADKVILGGTNNMMTIADGTFTLSDSFLFRAGVSNRLAVTGGTVALHELAISSSAKYARLETSGDAEVSVDAGPQTGDNNRYRRIPVGGEGGRFDIGGRSFDAGDAYLDLDNDGNVLNVTAGATKGDLCFAANDCLAFFGDGVVHTAVRPTLWRNPNRNVQTLRFNAGTSGNRLVLSNATYRCEKPFLDYYLNTTEGPTMEAVPFTGVPGSYIEFRGDHPKFLVTSGVPNPDSGAAWYAFALGEMIDWTETEYKDTTRPFGWKTARYRLDNPLKLRFVLPTGGYAEAPFQNTGTCGVLGGNAEFEFDLSDFQWPARELRIPLVYDQSGFTGWGGRKYVDIEGLNLVNADALPVNRGGATVARARLAMSADGKTLELVVPGNAGTVLIFR